MSRRLNRKSTKSDRYMHIPIPMTKCSSSVRLGYKNNIEYQMRARINKARGYWRVSVIFLPWSWDMPHHPRTFFLAHRATTSLHQLCADRNGEAGHNSDVWTPVEGRIVIPYTPFLESRPRGELLRLYGWCPSEKRECAWYTDGQTNANFIPTSTQTWTVDRYYTK